MFYRYSNLLYPKKQKLKFSVHGCNKLHCHSSYLQRFTEKGVPYGCPSTLIAKQKAALYSGLPQSSVKLIGRFSFSKALDQAQTEVAEGRAEKEQ